MSITRPFRPLRREQSENELLDWRDQGLFTPGKDLLTSVIVSSTSLSWV